MIFTPSLYSKPVEQLILNGEKTETRRLAKGGDVGIYYSGELDKNFNIKNALYCKVFRNGRLLWQVGKDYSVQLGRGKPGLPFRIEITQIRKERLLDITEEGARREGFDSSKNDCTAAIRKFISAFGKANKMEIKSIYLKDEEDKYNPLVWVIRFKVKEE